MAEVFRARTRGAEGFEKEVAVKRIHPHLASDEMFVRMFLDEARLAATLRHPNIAQVYDVGVERGEYFYAMELLDGLDVYRLARACRAAGTAIPLEHALGIVLGACAGLHYAHERRTPDGRPLHIVHRDVSPQNVFVTFEGGVKLLDFGIAKAVRPSTPDTTQGTLKGKVAYMSPEQCGAQPLDARSDVFSLSIVLWELTTGQRLYVGENDYRTMKLISEADAQRPSEAKPDYPPALEEIVMRGLARDRDQRFSSARELHLALEAFAHAQHLPLSSVRLGEWTRELARGATDPADAAMAPNVASTEGALLPVVLPGRQTKVAARGRQGSDSGTSRRAQYAAWVAAALAGVALVGFGVWARRPGEPAASAAAIPVSPPPSSTSSMLPDPTPPPVNLPPAGGAAATPPPTTPVRAVGKPHPGRRRIERKWNPLSPLPPGTQK